MLKLSLLSAQNGNLRAVLLAQNNLILRIEARIARFDEVNNLLTGGKRLVGVVGVAAKVASILFCKALRQIQEVEVTVKEKRIMRNWKYHCISAQQLQPHILELAHLFGGCLKTCVDLRKSFAIGFNSPRANTACKLNGTSVCRAPTNNAVTCAKLSRNIIG